MIELARPTMNRKDALTAAPNTTEPRQTAILEQQGWMADVTYDAPDLSHTVDVVVDICANCDGHILRMTRSISAQHRRSTRSPEPSGERLGLWVDGEGRLTTTITMVLCPREKNRPQVTGSWPRLMRLRVALSIALRSGGAAFRGCGRASRRECKVQVQVP